MQINPLYTPLTVSEVQELYSLLSHMLSTKATPVIIPGEAILGIEAMAAGIAAPGRTILNVVTGPYGSNFGHWLERGGANVVEVSSSLDDVITVDQVAAVIEKHKPDAISFVQAEAVTGGTNPTREILELAKANQIITVVDSVSAVGAEPILMDEWGLDIVAIGAQKALAGPNGVSAVGISERGWDFIASNLNAPRNSILSLLDLKNAHDDAAKGKISANIPTLEARALIEALRKIKEEGLDSVYRRHSLASASTIAGLKALGLEPWQKYESSYSPLVTTVRIPQESTQLDLERPLGIVAPGDGSLRGSLLRINHFGLNANPDSVEEAVITLAELLQQDPSDAIAEVKAVWNNR